MKILNLSKNSMKTFFLLTLTLLLCGALVLSGCGSSEGKAKKKKSKAEEEEVAEVEEKVEKKEEKEEKKDEKANAESKHGDKKGDEKTPSANEIWADLMNGNKQFVKGKYSAGNFLAERPTLAKGQKPQVIVLGCADSRVPPELIFGKNTGDLFVVRDAGNIVDELALGSMEYAVEHLHAKVIVVLGHESCGAVAAALSGEKMPTPNLQAIVNNISPAFEGSQECPIGGKMSMACVELNVHQTAKKILEKSPIIKEASENGLTVIKAVYRFETGEVVKLD